MKFFFRIIIVAALCYFAELFLPWWIIAIVAFAVGVLMTGSSTNAFLGGFLGVGLLWFGMALYISINGNSPLPERIAELFQLNSAFVLAAVTGLIGGIVGGLGALSGSYLRKLLDKKDTKYRYG